MCNSGSSALYLAIEVLGLQPGDEIITVRGDVLDRHRADAPRRARPGLRRRHPDTFQIDVDAIEAMIGPRTKAILAPNLIGNAPDWDGIRGHRRRATASGSSRTPATPSA